MIRSRKLWLGLGITILLLGLFLTTAGLGRMLEALGDANYFYVIPAVGLYLVSVLFRTLRWQMLMRHMRPVSVKRLYPVVVVGYMANNLLPLRLGELVRSYYVSEREGISKTSALATIFVERVLDAIVLLLFIAVIALFVPLSGLAEAFEDWSGIPAPLLVVGFGAPFVLAMAVLLLFAAYPERTKEGATLLTKPLPDRLRAPLRGLVDLFLEGLMPLRSARTLALLLAVSAPVWLFEAGLFFLIGYSFGLDVAYDNVGDMAVAMVLVTAIANIGSSVPAAPGGVGLFELVSRETLVLLPMADVARPVAAAFSTVAHAALLLPMIALGQVFLWTEHLSLRRLSRAGASGSNGPAERAEVSHSQGLTPAAASSDGNKLE
ncbi:MAG: lysylphosphatidylglycerol synthase transmembrane domain-containing protein [Chloroflexi bacterium]|nr:lysylphosphatidylglycerol synthase transmembrane domain-containing protein [Chloroflexota bacterium]